jgi:hypothetical protein
MIFPDLAHNQSQSYHLYGEDFFQDEEFLSLLVEKVFAIMEPEGIRPT